MRLHFVAVFASIAATLVACTVSSSDGGSSSGGSSSGGSSSGGSSSGGSSSGGSSSGGSSSGGAASTTEVPVEINAACPAVTACGGALGGTYDYTGGCVGDVFADARKQCPSLDTKNVTVKVAGSLFFDPPSALRRDGTAKIAGNVIVPAACSAGQCSAVESALKGSFDTIKCTSAGTGCDCAVTKTEVTKTATTYTIEGNTVKTADGDTYDYCVNATGFTYKGKSVGAEEGSWTLKKR